MLRKRNVVLLSLGICVLTALQAAMQSEGGFLRRLRARHVKETVFISAGNRRLAGFFDGMAPDPHWDAGKAIQVVRGVRQCASNRGGGLLPGWLRYLSAPPMPKEDLVT